MLGPLLALVLFALLIGLIVVAADRQHRRYHKSNRER